MKYEHEKYQMSIGFLIRGKMTGETLSYESYKKPHWGGGSVIVAREWTTASAGSIDVICSSRARAWRRRGAGRGLARGAGGAGERRGQRQRICGARGEVQPRPAGSVLPRGMRAEPGRWTGAPTWEPPTRQSDRTADATAAASCNPAGAASIPEKPASRMRNNPQVHGKDCARNTTPGKYLSYTIAFNNHK